MGKYKLENPLPPGELECVFEADNLKSVLQKILLEKPLVMRFTLLTPSKRSKHYKKLKDSLVEIPHRDFDDYTVDRLGDMCRDIGIVYRLSKHERLSLMDDMDEKVRSWMYNRYTMGYLGDGYHSSETDEEMTLILDGNEDRSGTFLKEKGLVKTFIEVSIREKSLLAQQRKQKKETVALENRLREKEKELENLRGTVSNLEETLSDTLRNFQTKIDTLTQENISLQSALTLDTFVPDGLTEKVSESERLISAFEGVELGCELGTTVETKLDFREALDKHIAEAFESLGGQEVCILDRDENGELQNPEEYQEFVDSITSEFQKLISSEKKIEKKD